MTEQQLQEFDEIKTILMDVKTNRYLVPPISVSIMWLIILFS